jgi:hypothetical protein
LGAGEGFHSVCETENGQVHAPDQIEDTQ